MGADAPPPVIGVDFYWFHEWLNGLVAARVVALINDLNKVIGFYQKYINLFYSEKTH